ncbi:lmo0937 family membrane protein [Verrucomicrobia bacterium LW23]|nr:lmo0937 family membrane protein [Verrucomicrobia bacterium LW23]
MLWGLVAILIMFWVLGNVMAYTAGGLLHLLVVAAVIISIIRLLGIGGRRGGPFG